MRIHRLDRDQWHRFACVDERFAGKPGRATLAPPAGEPLQEAGRGRGR